VRVSSWLMRFPGLFRQRINQAINPAIYLMSSIAKLSPLGHSMTNRQEGDGYGARA
jgi:hypothetical protein